MTEELCCRSSRRRGRGAKGSLQQTSPTRSRRSCPSSENVPSGTAQCSVDDSLSQGADVHVYLLDAGSNETALVMLLCASERERVHECVRIGQ